jgi:DNA-directed RNA polymerase subunit H (RpoH/RPB5)
MIIQRGYKITSEEEDKILGTCETKNICIFTGVVKKFSIERVKEYISLLKNMEIKECIIIYEDSITSMATKLIENTLDIDMELFTLDELQYNLTKNRLVPQHIKLSPEETKNFKQKHGIKFPVLLKKDPVARFYNFKKGFVIKIIKANGFISYRIVK